MNKGKGFLSRKEMLGFNLAKVLIEKISFPSKVVFCGRKKITMSLPILNIPNKNACGCADNAAAESRCLCPTTGLVQIIGRKYALRLLTIIGEFPGMRFNELKTALDDMSSSTLSIRLTELERAGLIQRETYAETPPRVEYALTAEGEKLRENLLSLSKFASRK